MLQNVTWLAIVAVHTAANELPKVRQVMNKIHRNVGEHGVPTSEVASWHLRIGRQLSRGSVPCREAESTEQARRDATRARLGTPAGRT